MKPQTKHPDAIMVLTRKSTETILSMGGTATWRIKPEIARQCQYVVCTRNAHHAETEDSEPHRTGFLIGRISGKFTPRTDKNGMPGYLIHISEYAEIEIPELWNRQRYPVHYTTLAELGINPKKLDWKPMPEPDRELLDVPFDTSAGKTNGIGPLTMAEAKQGLALMLNVPIEAIEITIRV